MHPSQVQALVQVPRALAPELPPPPMFPGPRFLTLTCTPASVPCYEAERVTVSGCAPRSSICPVGWMASPGTLRAPRILKHDVIGPVCFYVPQNFWVCKILGFPGAFRIKSQKKLKWCQNAKKRQRDPEKREPSCSKMQPDFQVDSLENQPHAAYIGRTALVPICQGPSQQMSQLQIFCSGSGGGE